MDIRVTAVLAGSLLAWLCGGGEAIAAEAAVRAEVTGLVPNGESQTLEIHGTADADQFKRAWLQIGAGDAPESWKYVGLKLKRPVREALLSEIPLSEFDGTGVWTVRINVEDKGGTVVRASKLMRLN